MNNPHNKPISSPIMSENTAIVPQKRNLRRISGDDVKAIAALVAKRIDEKGACLMLGIKPQTWYNWKGNEANSSKFSDVLALVRETKLNACLEAIDKAGDGSITIGDDGKPIVTRADWRAKAWLAEKVLAAERFGDKPAAIEQKTPLLAIISSDLAASVFGKLLPAPEPSKQIVDAQVIADTTNKPNG